MANTKPVVTQADRDAAARLEEHAYIGGEGWRTAVLEGLIDHDEIVQLFARHRLASQAAVSQDLVLIEVERDAEGYVLMCDGCGTVETIRSIKARSATAFSCCPERKMVRPASAIEAAQIAARNEALEAVKRIESDIAWTKKHCPNAPYVGIPIEVAEQVVTALRTPSQHQESEG